MLGDERLPEAQRLASEIYQARTAKLGETHPDTREALGLVIRVLEALDEPLEATEGDTLGPSGGAPELE